MSSQSNYDIAFQKFGQLGTQIELFNFHVVSKNLAGVLNRLDPRRDREYSQIKQAATIYRKAAANARRYVMTTKHFAHEIILLAMGVLARKNYSSPKVVLDYFQNTVDDLKEDFEAVVEQHDKVIRILGNAQGSITRVRESAPHRAIREAEDDIICNTPIFGIVASSVVMASNWSERVDNPIAKICAGTAGAVAGVARGAASTALLGIPMAVAFSRKGNLEAILRELQHIGDMLETVRVIVCKHRNLLDEICVLVGRLPRKAKPTTEALAKGESVDTADLPDVINTSMELKQSCDKYLNEVAYYSNN